MLRSTEPDGVYQELYAYLITYQAIRSLIVAAAGEGVDPDRLSFTVALRAVRRWITTAATAATGRPGRRDHGRPRRDRPGPASTPQPQRTPRRETIPSLIPRQTPRHPTNIHPRRLPHRPHPRPCDLHTMLNLLALGLGARLTRARRVPNRASWRTGKLKLRCATPAELPARRDMLGRALSCVFRRWSLCRSRFSSWGPGCRLSVRAEKAERGGYGLGGPR